MTLIKSISGIRGTIGGKIGNNLTAIDIVESTAAYAQIIKDKGGKLVVVGRDGRITGKIVSSLVCNTLLSMGLDVIDFGLSTTPGIEMAVTREKADAGVILTASHNPREWNALKFLNKKGEFISAKTGTDILNLIESSSVEYALVDEIGIYSRKKDADDYHIDQILKLPYINLEKIKAKGFHVVLDAINSTGAAAIPKLMTALGGSCTVINGDINGDFAHNPEPLPEHLQELAQKVREEKADVGIAVDPDVDRLALIMENGEMFGEEYTLVAVSDYILSKKRGSTVSNLSSTRALRDLTHKYDQQYFSAMVGEVNVVEKMKEVKAVIGGEGNGGVILPALHYGRDALVGIALILSLLSERNTNISDLKKTYPSYFISKNKLPLTSGMDPDRIIAQLADLYKNEEVNLEDGIKIDFKDSWVQLRKSNTEAIMRVYAEAKGPEEANQLAEKVMNEIKEMNKN